MGMYKHFTREERIKIGVLIDEGYEQSEIAEALGKNKGTISRELRRNSRSDGNYAPAYAHKATKKRRLHSKVKSRKIENNSSLAEEIEALLNPICSPETICHEIAVALCHATIYAWVYRSRPDLKKMLPYHGKKRRKYGHKRATKQGWTSKVPDIDTRPKSIDLRSDLYHYEGDTVLGSSGRLLTYTERVSRFEIAIKIPNGGCDIVHEKTREQFATMPAKSFTYDRGSEFALWEMIERDTGAKIYFAKAHHPWQRGTNENANGRLRRVFPKKFNFSKISQEEVDRVVWKMNHTKRKCLGWRTPCAVFGACCTSS
jgi:transposase, IS30 family